MKPLEESGWDRNVKRKCPICGKGYAASEKYLERGKQTTCSRCCSYALRGRQQQTRIERICGICREKFSRPASHIKGKHGSDFCSRRCPYTGRRLGLSKRLVTKPYQYTEGGRTKLSKTTAHLYASGKALASPKTELSVARTLSELGIEFTHQHVVEVEDGAYVVDFLFPNRLIVERDSPGRHNRELRDYDTKRDRRLRRLGFRAVRLWDNGRPENTVRAMLATLLEGTKRRGPP